MGKVSVLALGTRGDVLPLVAVSVSLREQAPDVHVTFITNRAHEGWMHPLADAHRLHLRFVDLPPARVWDDTQGGKRGTDGWPKHSWGDVDAHREQCLQQLESALGRQLQLPPAFAAAAPPVPSSAPSEGEPEPAGSGDGHCLVVINLFALEGAHVAEALRVPWAAASPCLVPYGPPERLLARLQRAHPELCAALLRAPPGSVSWAEVRHWLWPLFDEARWAAWRQHRLGLPAVPYAGREAALPPPPPLLYGVSPCIVPRPGFWPGSVHLCGFWDGARLLPAGQWELPPAIVELNNLSSREPVADAAEQRPDAIDFGSMGRLGFLQDPAALAALLGAAAERRGRRLLVLTGGWAPLGTALQELGSPLLSIITAPVRHDALLSRCAALVHHGGSGTTAAALRCGAPQVVCPFQFDQRAWAERVEWAGCGVGLDSACLFPALPGAGLPAAERDNSYNAGGVQREAPPLDVAAEVLATALELVSTDRSVLQRCRDMAEQLSRERAAGSGEAAAALRLLASLPPPTQEAAEGDAATSSQEPPTSRAAVLEAAPDGGAGGAPAVAQPALQEVELPGGLHVTCLSRSEAAFIHREIFQERCYLRHGVRLLPGAVVVDVGANIGLFALSLFRGWPPAGREQAAALAGPDTWPSVVWALEPVPQIADALAHNVAAHGLQDRVTVMRMGLHSAPGTLDFMYYPRMPGNSTCAPGEKWAAHRRHLAPGVRDTAFVGAARLRCPVTTLAAFVAEQRLRRIDLLKVDVEGAELAVLQGIDDAAWAATRALCIEVHDVAGRPDAVLRMLRQHCYATCAEPSNSVPGCVMVYAWREDSPA